MEGAQKTLNTDFRQGDINLQQIRDTLCGDGRSLLIKSKHEIDHIFSELYRVDERIRIPYFWIKVIELLLFLSLLDASYVKNPDSFLRMFPKGHNKHTNISLRTLFQNNDLSTGRDVPCGRIQLEAVFYFYRWQLDRYLYENKAYGGRCGTACVRTTA